MALPPGYTVVGNDIYYQNNIVGQLLGGVAYGYQTSVIPVPDGENSFPFLPKYPVNHIAINNKLIAQQQQIDSYAHIISQLQGAGGNSGEVFFATYSWGGSNIVRVGTYILAEQLPYQITLTSTIYRVGTAGGSFVFTVRNSGANVGGLTSVTASSNSDLIAVASDSQVLSQGAQLSVVVTAVTGSPTDAVIQVNGIKGTITHSGGTTVTINGWIDENDDEVVTTSGDQLVFETIV